MVQDDSSDSEVDTGAASNGAGDQMDQDEASEEEEEGWCKVKSTRRKR
jgi:hypothetical protein